MLYPKCIRSGIFFKYLLLPFVSLTWYNYDKAIAFYIMIFSRAYLSAIFTLIASGAAGFYLPNILLASMFLIVHLFIVDAGVFMILVFTTFDQVGGYLVLLLMPLLGALVFQQFVFVPVVAVVYPRITSKELGMLAALYYFGVLLFLINFTANPPLLLPIYLISILAFCFCLPLLKKVFPTLTG